MRRASITLALLGLLLLVGCGTLDQQFVKAVDDSWAVIGPEYQAYVQADPTLDAGTKKIRVNSAKTLSDLLQQAKAAK